jgi:hypothetical protein
MGYTHYWTVNKPAELLGSEIRAYEDACADCTRIANAWYQAHGGLAGFSAHTVPGRYGGVQLNGSRENGHEDFTMRETLAKAQSGFCKTARKPYDTVVTACLLVLADALPGILTIRSDGDAGDWLAGWRLAEEVLGRKLAIPDTIRISADAPPPPPPPAARRREPAPSGVTDIGEYRLQRGLAALRSTTDANGSKTASWGERSIQAKNKAIKLREEQQRNEYNKQLVQRLGLRSSPNPRKPSGRPSTDPDGGQA